MTWSIGDFSNSMLFKGFLLSEQTPSLQEPLEEKFLEAIETELKAIAREYRNSFRIYSTSALLAILSTVTAVFLFELSEIIFPIVIFVVLFFVLAIKSSYRCWQISTGNFSRPRAFKTWCTNGRLFV